MTLPVGGVSAAATAAAAPAAGAADDAAKAGEGFERMLLGQLTRTLLDSALPEGASGAAAAYKDALPDALTEALMSGGGIGLAKLLEEGSS